MKFGSNEFYYRLKDAVFSGKNDHIYLELYDTINDDISSVLWNIKSSSIKVNDIEDIKQTIQEKVFKNLLSFLETSDDMAEAQRNSWLLTLARNVIADYCRIAGAIKRPKGNIAPAEEIKLIYETPSAEDDTPGFSLSDIADTSLIPAEKELVQREELKTAITYVLSLDSKPEKLLAYLFETIIADLFLMYENSVDAIWLFFKDKSLFVVRDKIRCWLEIIICNKLPEKAFHPMNKKLNKIENGLQYGDKSFNISMRELTVWKSELRKRIEGKRFEVLEGGDLIAETFKL